MNNQTLIVLIVDGGLVILFLYALYYISRLERNTLDASIDSKTNDEPVAVEVNDYEPERAKEETEHIDTSDSFEPEVEPISKMDIEKTSIETTDEVQVTSIDSLIERETVEEGFVLDIDVIEIEGIGEVYAQKLKDISIHTVQELLERGATRDGREEISSVSEISPKLILEWVNHADLFRIDGIGRQYSDLLEAAGVDTVPELARRNPENLLERMREINQEKNLVNRLPSLNAVENWVAQARLLPRKIEY